jgi:hypothetical protein
MERHADRLPRHKLSLVQGDAECRRKHWLEFNRADITGA